MFREYTKELNENPKWHEYSKLFDMMNEKQYNLLLEDIRENGQLEPIIMFNEQVLDGRNRLRACKFISLKPKTIEFVGTDKQALQFVISKNLNRRHLDDDQRARTVARISAIKLLEASEANNGVIPKEVRKEINEERNEMAKQFNVSEHTVYKLEKIYEKAPVEVIKALESEKITLAHAQTLVTLPHTLQVQATGSSAAEVRALVDEVKHITTGTPTRLPPEVQATLLKNFDKKVIFEATREIKAQAAAKQEARRSAVREVNAQLIEKAEDPTTLQGVYSTVLLDPPWEYADVGMSGDATGRNRPDYQTMSFSEILKLPVGKLADDNAHVYLWTTNNFLRKSYELLEEWGFARYTMILTWIKEGNFGLGAHFRSTTEFVLFGMKGQLPLKAKNIPTHFSAPRGRNGHSSKPIEFYDFIENASPGPYLEMFSRVQRPGWKTWGQNGIK